MVRAVERVRERLLRATAALEAAGVPYAVVGGNAVAAWVARVDPSAVRNTQGVDVLLRRADAGAAERALLAAGFIRRHVAGVEAFLDGPNARMRDAVHVVSAGGRVRPDYPAPTPDVGDAEKPDQFYALSLEALVRMELTSFRLKDQVHLQDLIAVGLVDASRLSRLPPELAERLRQVIEAPE